MKNAPIVSIVIPVYNVEQYLDECMESILQQTYSKLDIILVDDGSKDHSSEMCDKYAKKDSRIQVLHKENGGLVSAWIAGVKISKGDYLVFVDSDDWVDLNMIEELVKHSIGSSKEIICSNYVIEKLEKQKSIKVKQSMKPGVYEREQLEKELFPQLLGNEVRRVHASRCMKLISKELIMQNLQYTNQQVTMGEDLNIMFAAMLDMERLVVLEEGYFYHYRLVDTSMAHKYNPKMYEKVRLLGKTLQDIIEKKISSQDKKRSFLEGLRKEYIFLLFFVLKNELRGPGKGLVTRIQTILRDAKEEMQLEQVMIEVTGKANRLLYFIWQKPDTISVTIGRIAIKLFDRM